MQPGTGQAIEGSALPAHRLGKYELVARIGKGGMAEVYLARMVGPMNFQKVVVVKTIHPDLAEQEEFLTMLLDEARVSALIKHPHVVDIYDLGHEHDTYFIAMEYLDGQPLSAVMNAGMHGDPLDAYSTARIVADAAEGLHAAHELKSISGKPLELVHRDVSPGNIIVLYDGDVKLVDFGIAKARGRLTRSGLQQLKGKAGYMSPEQAAGEPVDRRSDIFSLGVVLWEALTFKRLFGEDGIRRGPGNVPPPSSIRPEIVSELDDACLSALAPRPRDRYQTAKQMQDTLEDVLRSVGYYRETSVIPRYMTRVFASRREERQRLLRERSNTIVGQAIQDVLGPSDLVVEVTRDTGPGTPPSLTPRSVTPRPATPRPTTPRPAPPRRGWQAFFGVLCLVALGAAGGFLWYSSPPPSAGVEPTAPPPAPEPEPEPEPPPAVAAPEPAAVATPPTPEPEAQAPERRAPRVKPVALDTPDAGVASEKTAQELYDEGTALFVQGKVEQAKQKFKEAIDLDPAHAASYKGLGLAYQAQGKDEKAARAFEKYLSLEPNASDAASIKERIAQLRQ